MEISKYFVKGVGFVKKHSPLILTGLGITGVGATAYFAYKAKPKVDQALTDIEGAKAAGIEVPKYIVAYEIGKAVILPVTTGILSAGCFIWSYKIQKNRITVLAGAVSTLTAEKIATKQKLEEKLGKEEAEEFYNTVKEKIKKTNSKGKETEEEVNKKDKLANNIFNGFWFDESIDCTEDHDYNESYCRSVISELELTLFKKSKITVNEVLSAFGMDITRGGALLGWTGCNPFLDLQTNIIYNPETGQNEKKIFVQWSSPSYIYGEVDF